MNLKAFSMGCNAVCYIKNNQKFGMICAWAQMIDHDKITLLLGEQSDTGQNISIGDRIGVSALSIGQNHIVDTLGDNHSTEMDKFVDIKYKQIDSIILVDDAKIQMQCEVIDILKLSYIPKDKFIVLKVLAFNDDKTKKYYNYN